MKYLGAKKSLKNTLLDSFIKSDFCLVQQKSLSVQFNVKKALSIKLHETLFILNFLDSIKMLMQFIRFLKCFKAKRGNNCLKVIIEDNAMLELFKEALPTKRSANINCILSSHINEQVSVNELKDKKRLVGVVYFQSSLIKNKYLLPNLLSKNIYLMQKINCFNERNNFGFYKLHNDFVQLKKSLFFLCLIKRLL